MERRASSESSHRRRRPGGRPESPGSRDRDAPDYDACSSHSTFGTCTFRPTSLGTSATTPTTGDSLQISVPRPGLAFRPRSRSSYKHAHTCAPPNFPTHTTFTAQSKSPPTSTSTNTTTSWQVPTNLKKALVALTTLRRQAMLGPLRSRKGMSQLGIQYFGKSWQITLA